MGKLADIQRGEHRGRVLAFEDGNGPAAGPERLPVIQKGPPLGGGPRIRTE